MHAKYSRKDGIGAGRARPAAGQAALEGPATQLLAHCQLVADGSPRVGAQAAALPRQAAPAGPATGAVVQRVILFKDEPVEQTWNAVHKKATANAALLRAIQAAQAQCPELTEEEFGKSWDRLKRAKSFADLGNAKQFADAVRDSHGRAETSSVRLAGNNAVSEELVGPMVEAAAGDLRFSGGARAKLVPTGKHVHHYDPTIEKERQTARHLSTVLFETNKKGEEVQSSFARDKGEVFISTNLNGVNESLRKQVTSQEDLKREAAQIALARNLENVSRKAAMQDRVLRHAMKLFGRIDNFLDTDCKVTVPGAADFDGRHAEVRIAQDEENGWSIGKFFLPAGVKVPCLGCALYFDAAGMLLGARVGPMWLTAVSISTQIEAETGNKATLTELTPEQIHAIATSIARQYAAARQNSPGFKLGSSKTKHGKATTVHDPDSESELDDEEFERVRKQMLTADKPKPAATGSKPRKRKVSGREEAAETARPTKAQKRTELASRPADADAEEEDMESDTDVDARMDGEGEDEVVEDARPAAFDPSIFGRRVSE